MKAKITSRYVIVLLALAAVLVLCIGVAQVRQTQPIAQAVRQLAVPQITMQRGVLESPRGMNIFETRVLQVPNAVIQNFAQAQGLVVKQVTPVTQLRRMNIGRIYAEKENISRVLVDTTRGHTVLLPHVEQMAKGSIRLLNRDQALNTGQLKLNELRLITPDVSRATPKQLLTLSRADMKQGGQTGNTQDVMQTVLFQRTINDKQVVGNGSVLALDLGNQGEVVGMIRNWNELVPSKITPEFRTDAEVYGDIETIVKAQIRGNVRIEVQTPRLVYYGDDQKYVQPAYFFTAVIAGTQGIEKSYFAGYVSALKNSPEAIQMSRDPNHGTQPVSGSAALSGPGATIVVAEDDPTIGRYVNREDSWDWVDDANDFKNGLIAGHTAALPALTFGDYFWNEPRFWTNQENSFVDKWHVTLMEGHGANWLFSTRSNCCDLVNLNAATQPGYGNRAGDSMRFLILKSCSVVPAPPDRANWADPWYRVFKGLRQAIGFRTTMYINDDISYHFGYHIGNNCRVLDSWFHATNGSGSYGWNRFWGAEVTGYGAVVMIPGQEGVGIYSTSAAPPATTTGLTIWWQH